MPHEDTPRGSIGVRCGSGRAPPGEGREGAGRRVAGMKSRIFPIRLFLPKGDGFRRINERNDKYVWKLGVACLFSSIFVPWVIKL